MHYFMANYKNNEQSIKETLFLNSNEGDKLFPPVFSCHNTHRKRDKAWGQRKQTYKCMVFQGFLHKLIQELLEMLDLCMENHQAGDI